jgi:hypothetical protein
MGYVRIELVRGILVPGVSIVPQTRTTIIAIIAANMVLVPTTATAVGQLAARHGHKGTMTPLNYFEIANYKAVVKSNRTKCPQPIFRLLHQLDPNLGDVHSC